MIGADRGLAYDLLGRHARSAGRLSRGACPDAMATKRGAGWRSAWRSPATRRRRSRCLRRLMAQGDAAAARCRALGARADRRSRGRAALAIEAAMPGSSVATWRRFFAQAADAPLRPEGGRGQPRHFPRRGRASYAYVSAARDDDARSRSSSATRRRGATRSGRGPARLDRALAVPGDAGQCDAVRSKSFRSRRSRSRPRRIPTIAARQELRSSGTTYASRELWMQLASGPNPDALCPTSSGASSERNNELFDGISGYVAEEPDRARLLIGPFRNSDDAKIFVDDLESVRVDAFSWTSPPGQTIRKLPTE